MVMAVGGGLVYFHDPQNGATRRSKAHQRINDVFRSGREIAREQGMNEVAGVLDKAESVTRKRRGRSNGSVVVSGPELDEIPIIVTPTRAK